ncbi:MAG: hypothetical protein Q8R28_18105 [Dehalococcoidia bacterium]|nr:hypothetical protein [Dehalococcoidia bacterium]
MTTNSANSFPFLDILQEDPRLAYYSSLYGGGERLPPAQQQYYGGQFNDIYSQYLGTQGQGLRDAQQQGLSLQQYLDNPDTSFLDYLGTESFGQRYRALPPSLRAGSSQARFAPPTRWVR